MLLSPRLQVRCRNPDPSHPGRRVHDYGCHAAVNSVDGDVRGRWNRRYLQRTPRGLEDSFEVLTDTRSLDCDGRNVVNIVRSAKCNGVGCRRKS